MILEHFSSNPLAEPRDFEQPVTFHGYKPRGLWVSVRGEDDWLEWCKAEHFAIPENFVFRNIVHMAPSARIVQISTIEELDAFDDRFGAEALAIRHFTSIRWRRVAELYDGIIIAPYQWGRRLSDKCRWYYSWDCASGCIWNASAISHFETVDPPVFEEEIEEEYHGTR